MTDTAEVPLPLQAVAMAVSTDKASADTTTTRTPEDAAAEVARRVEKSRQRNKVDKMNSEFVKPPPPPPPQQSKFRKPKPGPKSKPKSGPKQGPKPGSRPPPKPTPLEARTAYTDEDKLIQWALLRAYAGLFPVPAVTTDLLARYPEGEPPPGLTAEEIEALRTSRDTSPAAIAEVVNTTYAAAMDMVDTVAAYGSEATGMKLCGPRITLSAALARTPLCSMLYNNLASVAVAKTDLFADPRVVIPASLAIAGFAVHAVNSQQEAPDATHDFA